MDSVHPRPISLVTMAYICVFFTDAGHDVVVVGATLVSSICMRYFGGLVKPVWLEHGGTRSVRRAIRDLANRRRLA